jgi:hypothetical protein
MLPAHRRGELAMPDSETAALLRTVLDELCAQLPNFDASTRTNVASRLLEAVEQGRCSLEDLREVGKEALHKTPTMWR